MISDAAQRQAIPSSSINASFSDSIKKGLLKSMSTAGSQDKGNLEAKSSVNRAPSPIPEDPREEEANKSTKSRSSEPKEPKESKKLTDSKDGSTEVKSESGKELTEEEKKKKKEEEEEKKKLEEEKKKKKEEDDKRKKDTAVAKPAGPPKKDEEATTTKLRGKSKATGQIMGGWI